MLRLLTTITITLGAAAQLALGAAQPRIVDDETTARGARDEFNFDMRSLWSQARPRSEPPYPRRSLEELAKRDDSIEEDPNGMKYLWSLEDTYAGTTFFE